MSDRIDLEFNADGDDGVNRLTSAIERLTLAMTELGDNSAASNLAKQMELMQGAMNTALGTLTQQMAEMKQVMATGFADISATSINMIKAMGERQAREISDSGDQSANAMKEANAKLIAVQQADARTILQASRGLSGNVENAFAQMAAGISPEAVRQRFGEIATETAKGFKTIDDMMQFRANAKSVKTTAYDPMAGATAAEIDQARAMNASKDTEAAEAAAARIRQIDEQSLALKWRNMLDLNAKEDAEKVAQAARWLQIDEASQASSWLNFLQIEGKKAAEETARAERWAQMDEASQASSWMNFLQIERQKEAEEAARAARWRQLDESAQASSWTNFLDIEAKKEAAEAQRIARARTLQEQSDASAWRNFLDIEAKKAAEAESTARKNAAYSIASPASRLQTQMGAVAYSAEGLDPAKAFGSTAAADAAGKSVAGLRAELAALRTTSAEVGAAQFELEGAVRQVESAFKGAAHEAGIYGLAHGQLIALLAGGAVAAALHHIAETGAEVEFQLASFPALADRMNSQPVDMNHFIGITAGTMTSLKDAAEGMHALAQAGIDQHAALAALPDIMRLAQLGEMSVGQAAEMAVESMHAFGMSITDIGQIGDILVTVGSKSNVSVGKLAEDMKSAAVTGQMFGASMQEITATVGVLAERGLTIQPLSSALMKLYEPSDKVAKAMHELGLSTKDSSGNLKDYTQFMGELAQTVGQFKVPADIFKLLGMSSRDSKAVEVMTSEFHAYKTLSEEAANSQGKMFDATLVKMDTAEGAWKRLGSTVEGSVTTAFEAAQPAVEGLEEALIRIAGSDGTVTLLSHLATAAANLSTALVDNAGALGTLAAGYAGMRVVTSVIEWFVQLQAAEAAQAVAAETAAAANTTQTESLILLANGERAAATATVTLGEVSVVAATGMEEAALGAKLLTSSLGWIGVVLMAATTAYELFFAKQSEADSQFQKAINTADTSIDMYDKEIQRLKDLEEQLLKTGKAGVDAANEVATANLEFELSKAKSDVARLANQRQGDVQGPAVSEFDIHTNSPLEDAQARAAKLEATLALRDQRATQMDALRDRTGSEQKISGLHDKIESFDSVIFPSSTSKAAKDAADKANELLQSLRSTVIVEDNYNEVKQKELDLEKLISDTKKDAPAKAAGDKDGAHVRIEQLQEELRLKKELLTEGLNDAKSENKRGELGDLQLINKELALRLEFDKFASANARAELAAAGPLKPGQQQRYQSRIDSADAQPEHDKTTAERQRLDALDRMGTEELQHRAKTLTSMGQLDEAYNLTWAAKYGDVLDKLDADIEDKDNAKYRGQLTRYRQFLLDMKDEGEKAAIFKMDVSYFDADIAELKNKLSALKSQSGPGAGLSTVVDNSLRSRGQIANSLPKLREDYAVAKSDAGNDPAKLKAAEGMLKQIQEQSDALRNSWVGIGETISKSLTEAFGKSGTALGGLMTTTAAFAAKYQEIQETLASSDGGQAAQQKAADDMASAQIKAYGDMAGAAKGFFDVNSGGYKKLHAAEQAFRVYELAMAIGNAVKKIALEGGVTAAVLGGEAVKSAAVVESVGVQLAADDVKGMSAAAVAVATQAQGDPYSAWVRMAAMAAAMAALGFAVGGGGGADTTAKDRQAANGTGTIAGDPTAKTDSIAKSLDAISKNTYDGVNVSQDMLTALQSIANNITSFAGQLVQSGNINSADANHGLNTNNGGATTLLELGLFGVLTPLLAKIPVIGNLIGKVATSIFGGKQTLSDDGFTMNASTLGQVASQGATAKTYQDVITSGGWFHGDSHDTNTSNLSADANRSITQVITSIGDAVKASASVLGLSGSAFNAKLNSFVIDLGKISLKDLSSADQQTAINNAFSKLGDEMATFAVSTITQFSKAGEGALQTLTRVANDYATVDAVFQSFGSTFSQVGMESIAARENLIDLAGGLDKFTSQADFFLKNIMPAGQQIAAQRNAIDPTLAKYGLSSVGPNAVQQFANVVIAMGSMGSAGAQAYTELMAVAPAFKAVTDASKDLQDQIDALTLSQTQQTAAARAALDPVNQGLFDQLQQAKAVSAAKSLLESAYESESQSIQTAIDRLKQFSLSLHAFVNSLQLGNLSPLNPTDKYGAAMAQFNDTLTKAKSGDVTAQGNLQSAAQAFLQASRDANASDSVYQADYQRVITATDGMATIADQQVSAGEQNLIELRTQVSQLIEIKGATLSVVEAINNLAIAMSGGKDQSTNDKAIESLYQELLGRPADTAGKAYWENLLNNGTSLSTIVGDFKSSAEYNAHTDSLPVTQPVTASTQNPQVQIDALYEQLLGRAPDQAGEDYWVDRLKNGASISAITQGIEGSDEYAHPVSAASVPPVVQAPIVSAPASTPDPYTQILAQNAQVAAGLAQVANQVAGLRQDQQAQADNQVAATMTAAAGTGDQVAAAVTTSSQAAAWSSKNAVALR